MKAVDTGDKEETVRTGIGLGEAVGQTELLPGYELTEDKNGTENDSGGDPGHGTAGDWLAESEPLIHDVTFTEHVAASNFNGDGA